MIPKLNLVSLKDWDSSFPKLKASQKPQLSLLSSASRKKSHKQLNMDLDSD